jgi:hypothetical protein
MTVKLLSHSFSTSRLFPNRSMEGLQVIGLAMIAGVLFLFNLGKGALADWDEAIYAENSKEIVSGHQWLTLFWQHKPFFEKPPLSIWIRAALFQLFGVSEFWARFESAVAGIAIVLLTYAIARRLSGATVGFFAASGDHGCTLVPLHLFGDILLLAPAKWRCILVLHDLRGHWIGSNDQGSCNTGCPPGNLYRSTVEKKYRQRSWLPRVLPWRFARSGDRRSLAYLDDLQIWKSFS